MDTDTNIQFLENKIPALKAKMEVAKTKGMFDHYEIFANELRGTEINLYLQKKMRDEAAFYTSTQVQDALIAKVREKLPSMTMVFKDETAQTLVAETIREIFPQVIAEFFKNRIVSIEEK